MEKSLNIDLSLPVLGGFTEDVQPFAGSEENRGMNIVLLVIDLTTCARCVPTGEQLRKAIKLLTPLAIELGIELNYRELVINTQDEAKKFALLSSPTIRINGREIDQNIHESLCESCCEISNGEQINCREWNYRGKIYPSAPLPMLLEIIMTAMLNIDDQPPIDPDPIPELPQNLIRFFENKDRSDPIRSSCC